MPFTDSAAWFEQVGDTLRRYDESLLRTVAGKLFKPRNQWPADELIERSLTSLKNPVVVDRRLKELGEAERRVLALIAHSRQPRWHMGNLVEMVIALGHPDGVPPILALLETGLLYPYLSDDVKRLKSFEQWLGHAIATGFRVFAPPEVTARAIGEDFALPELPVAAALPLSPVHEGDGLEWPLRLAVLWQQVAAGPLRRTQQGDFFKRDLERLGEDTLLTAAPADSLAPLPDPALLTVALAEIEGVLQEQKGELHAGTLPPSWDAGTLPVLAALWSALPWLANWNPLDGWAPPAETGRGNPYPSAYLLSLLLLTRAPGDGWASPQVIEEWLFAQHPYWANESVRPSQRRSWVPAFLIGLAYHLKIVQAAKGPEGDWLVRLSPTGRWLLGLGPAPEAQAFPQTLMVQPNLEVIAYRQGLSPGLIAQLARVAQWKNLGAACLLTLSADSVYRALQSGLSFEQIRQFFDQHGMRALPATVLDSLRTWADKRERIAVYPSATLFEFATAADLQDALSRGLPAVRLTDRLAVVASESSIDFRHFRLSGTRDYGLPPEKCVEVESDGVTLSIDLAKSDLLVETEMARFAEPVEPSAREGRRQYRVTLTSLASQRNGGSVRGLEDWFAQRTGQPLPPAARLLATAGHIPAVVLRRRLLLHVGSPEVADGLQQWPQTRALIEERLGPTTLAVTEENAPVLRQRLQSLGLNLPE